jgi:hypothetical protein
VCSKWSDPRFIWSVGAAGRDEGLKFVSKPIRVLDTVSTTERSLSK